MSICPCQGQGKEAIGLGAESGLKDQAKLESKLRRQPTAKMLRCSKSLHTPSLAGTKLS